MSNTKIKIKNSGIIGKVPESLDYGELAVNYADGKLFYLNSSNVISNLLDSDYFSSIIVNDKIILATVQNDILSFSSDSLELNANNKTISINIALEDSISNTSTKAASANSVYTLYETLNSQKFDKIGGEVGNITVNGTLSLANVSGILESNNGIVTSVGLNSTSIYTHINDDVLHNNLFVFEEASTTEFVMDSFPINEFCTAEYLIQGREVDTNYIHASKVLLAHNGIEVFYDMHQVLLTNNTLLYNINPIINGTNVEFRVTALIPGISIKTKRNIIPF